MHKSALLIGILALSMSVCAEYRIWTSEKGYSVEAEYKGTENGKVILRKRDGKVYKMYPSALCEADRTYLEEVDPGIGNASDPSSHSSVLDEEKPPRLTIKVSKKTDTGATDWDWVEREVSCTVKLKKESMQPYKRELKATLYVIGKAKSHDWYVMLDKKDFTFDFSVSDNVELPGDNNTTRHYRTYNGGIEFEGYLVVIYDDNGKVLEVEASSNKFRDSRSKFAQFRRDDVFTKSFEKQGTRNSMNMRDWQW